VDPPTELVATPVVVGAGPPVEAGQTLAVQYVGVTWDDGAEFDSSWERGESVEFPIGVGRVIPGWDKGLVGVTAGSRILLVIPPADGYGEAGQPSAGITGTDTLVFVVDVLGSY
jgi:peptidylprolyl isomerase